MVDLMVEKMVVMLVAKMDQTTVVMMVAKMVDL